MKPKHWILIAPILLLSIWSQAQTVSARTNEFEVDFSGGKQFINSTIPVVTWLTPIPETTFAQDSKFKIKAEVTSTSPLKSITISIKETVLTASRGMLSIQPEGTERYNSVIEKSLTLMDGENLIEIIAENMEGLRTITYRKVHVGSASLADATKLNRTDYALIFATDNYDNWSDLVLYIYFECNVLYKDL